MAYFKYPSGTTIPGRTRNYEGRTRPLHIGATKMWGLIGRIESTQRSHRHTQQRQQKPKVQDDQQSQQNLSTRNPTDPTKKKRLTKDSQT